MYYGNIEAQQTNLGQNKTFKKMMQFLLESEEKLLKNLKDDELSCFQKFSDSWSYINAETARESFENGFRLGAKCIIDVFDD